ncbi:sulfate transporter 3.1-like isoform X1 [Durio zibethinus]|uniref:Sulfate transporter 3.1-like isoform X1 n=1 Tax=Durio zibethinus TaxID=66656 RepID=A0A6P6B1X0_DURZI|nr:sulfate transporter 3.1-like isoform X1 [Durio zibethinus]
MGNADYLYPSTNDHQCAHRVAIPPPQPFFKSFKNSLKETFFPDDPLRQFKNKTPSRKFILGLGYFLPILDWAPRYSLQFLKADLIAGITIASLAIPQGISYAKLANLPPILGLYSSFIPPLVYAMMGSSRDLAVGTVAVASLLTASMLGQEVNASENPTLYLHLAFTATLFAGLLQASLGLLRLGFIVDFLSHATIVGFMAGAATVVCLQQLKGILGLDHFTQSTDIISVLRSVFTQTDEWRWESAVLGVGFLFFLLITKYFSKRRPKFFWISAMAPLASIILGSLLVFLTHAEKHGVQVIGNLKKGLNPPSFGDFVFTSPYMSTAAKTGMITGIIALAEGIAVGRSFAMFKHYHVDGNKEMVAIGTMNIVGSCFSCYLTTGPFSRSAVNFNAGCKTAMSNVIMAIAVMFTLLFLTPLFHYTPLVVLSAIIIAAILGLIDYEAAICLWKVDKFDFVVCMSAYIGVVFASVEVGLIIAVAISVLRLLLFVARPRTIVLGNIPNSTIYRNVEQYPKTDNVPGVLILEIDAPIYFANSSYLRERISRWIDEEEDKPKSTEETSLQYVILDMSAVGNIDTSGISMLEEVKKTIDRRGLKLVLANPGAEVMKKLNKSKFLENIGQEWIYLTVGEAVEACNYKLHTCKPDSTKKESQPWNNV